MELERVATNHADVGSNPTGGLMIEMENGIWDDSLTAKHLPVTEKDCGSNPLRPLKEHRLGIQHVRL